LVSDAGVQRDAAAWSLPGGSDQLAKLANQAIVSVTIGAVAEALFLAAAGGADPGVTTLKH
jgi:hypothetical protein